MTHKRRRSNAGAGVLALLGSLAAGAAVAVPWLTVDAGGVAVAVKGLLQAHPDVSAASAVFAHAGPALTAVAAAAVLASVLLALTHGFVSFLLRVVLLAAALGALALGSYLVVVAHTALTSTGQATSALGRALRAIALAGDGSQAQLRAGVGAYLLLGGGALILIAVFVPGRQSRPAPHLGAPPELDEAA